MKSDALYPTISVKQLSELIVNKKSDPFMVAFTANFLGEGAIMDAIIMQLSEEFHGQFGFYRIDMELHKDISQQFGIRRLPTILFFKNGEFMEKFIGMKPKRILHGQISQLIS